MFGVIGLSGEGKSTLVRCINRLESSDSGKILFNHEKINIGELLRESILTFEDKLNQKSIELDCKIQDIIQNIDRSYLEIIFNNIISNAIKFTNPNGKINKIITTFQKYRR